VSAEHDQTRTVIGDKMRATPWSAHLRLVIDGPILKTFTTVCVWGAITQPSL
jgi:hypothetical protein